MKHYRLGTNNGSSYRRMSSSLRFFGTSVIRRNSGVGIVLLTACFLLLQGCAGNSTASNNGGGNTPPPLNPATVTVAAPASGATVAKLPMIVKLNLLYGATLDNLKVTLDGNDITSSFSTETDGTATAQISKKIYIGNNRIQVLVGSQTVKSQFIYDPSTSKSITTPSPVAVSTALPDVVPIQTRVQTTNSQGQQVWGIQIGQTAYPDPNAFTNGFQVLLLNRSNLAPVYNASFQLSADQDVANFVSFIQPGGPYKSACGLAGCLEVIQSLNTIGYTGCPGPNCYIFQNALASIGATTTLGIQPTQNGNGAQNLAYSFVGNVGNITLHAGSFFERVTCSSSDGCIAPFSPQNSNNNQAFLNGIAPNGVDGTMPNLANTGSSGTTSVPATKTNSMPTMAVSNNGAMAGELVLDNTSNYTFAYANPPIHFEMGVAPDSPTKNLLTLTIPAGSLMTFPGGQTTQKLESAQLPANPDGSPVGGFRLVVFDAVTFQNLLNATFVINPNACSLQYGQNYCTGPDGTPIYHLDQLANFITQFNSRKNILFVASMGNLNHNISLKDASSGTQYNMQDVWDRAGQAIQDIGGTYATFVSLNNPAFGNDAYGQYTQNTVPKDDYALVGQWWINDSGVANPYAIEASSQISRQTSKYPVPSNVQGALEMENDGYYRVTLSTQYSGLLPDAAFTLTSAPRVPPVAWPLADPGPNAAYQWISQQLLACVNGCNDIRAAYTNLNQSPAIWLNLMGDLDIPTDCGSGSNPCPPGFLDNDFDTAKTQLLTEFQYLGVLRQYQNNVVGLLQAEQANVSVILQETTDEVLGNVQYIDTTTSYGISNWRQDVEDGLNIIGALSNFAGYVPDYGTLIAGSTQASIGTTDFILDASAKQTNDPNGRPLIEQAHDLTVASGLAQKKADQYAQTLISVGADFSRIASDWGRLQMVAQPIVNNDFVWAPDASGQLLKSFDMSIRRSFYKSLLASGYWIVHYRYAAPGVFPNTSGYQRPGSPQCLFWQGLPGLLQNNPDAYAYFPGALIDGPGSTVSSSLNSGNLFPWDLWWDVWALQDKNSNPTCVTDHPDQLPSRGFYNATGLFRPIDPGNPTPLGFYKPWFYQRSGVVVNEQVGTSTDFWYQNSPPNSAPYTRGLSDWYPDPDNY